MRALTPSTEVFLDSCSNPDGQIPEPPSDYQNQTLSLVKPEGDYSGITVPYSRSYLFSRSPWEVTAFDERDVGAVGGQDIDQAYTVIVPAGHRFSLALDGITNDIDLFIYELETNDGTNFSFVDSDNNSNNGLTPHDSSQMAGESAEVVSFDATDREEDTPIFIGMDRVPTSYTQQNNTANQDDGLVAQASIRRQAEAGWITSQTPCPDVYHESTACSPDLGGAHTLYGRNFSVNSRVFVGVTEAVCAPMVPGNSQAETLEARYDHITCITPPAPYNAQETPRATLMVQTDTGSVATYPETLTYLPPRPKSSNWSRSGVPPKAIRLSRLTVPTSTVIKIGCLRWNLVPYQAEVTHIDDFGNSILVRLHLAQSALNHPRRRESNQP